GAKGGAAPHPHPRPVGGFPAGARPLPATAPKATPAARAAVNTSSAAESKTADLSPTPVLPFGVRRFTAAFFCWRRPRQKKAAVKRRTPKLLLLDVMEAIHFRMIDPLLHAPGPADLDAVDRRPVAQAEVDGLRRLRQVPARRLDLAYHHLFPHIEPH